MAQLENKLCPYCKSSKVRKAGFIPSIKGKKQRIQCYDCGHTFPVEKLLEMAVTN